MEIDPNNLPQDAATLRCLVASLLEDRDSQERWMRQLQHMLEQLLRARYGPRRERVNENQLFLFAAVILRSEKNEPEPKDKSVSDRPRRKGHGRQRLPASLTRILGLASVLVDGPDYQTKPRRTKPSSTFRAARPKASRQRSR